MNIQPGSILISAPSMDDPHFEKVVVFITEHNEKGAVGFVLNQLFDRKFNELMEFKHSPPFPLYEGGPVEKEGIFFVHQRPDLIEQGVSIAGAVYLGGNFKQVVGYINNNNLTDADVKLFIGYCGWDDRQLEEEIAEGSWILVDAPVQIVFSTDTSLLWDMLYEEKR